MEKKDYNKIDKNMISRSDFLKLGFSFIMGVIAIGLTGFKNSAAAPRDKGFRTCYLHHNYKRTYDPIKQIYC